MSECVCLCASSLKASGSAFFFLSFFSVAVTLLARGRFLLVDVVFVFFY